jgi:hypothetical protein
MNVLFPAWTSAKADEEKLGKLHDLAVELLLQGVHADMSAAQMQLLTAKLTSREVTSLKRQMLRPGFVEEWNSLDALAAKFAKVLLSKVNSSPSAGFKLFTSYDPEAILWLGFTSKDAAVRERFNLFLKVWPEVRQRIPHALMQEMRITQELPAYNEIVQSIFLELIDGRLTAPEEMRAFLEPHSPPAPPPREVIKRPRAKRGAEAKLREHAYEDDEEAVSVPDDEDLDDIGGEDEIDLGLSLPKVELDQEIAEDVESAEDELAAEEHEPVPVPIKLALKTLAQPKPVKEALPSAPAPAPQKAEKPAATILAAKPVAPIAARAEKPQPVTKPKPAPKPASKPMPKSASARDGKTVKPVAKAKPAAAKAVKVAKAPVKAQAKPPVKTKAKPPVKAKVKPAKSVPAKGKQASAAKSKAGKAPAKPSRPAGKKAVSKPGKKR